jgi:hypothetical protein
MHRGAFRRRSWLDLTINVYSDAQLLDVAGALGRLPEDLRQRRCHQHAAAWDAQHHGVMTAIRMQMIGQRVSSRFPVAEKDSVCRKDVQVLRRLSSSEVRA